MINIGTDTISDVYVGDTQVRDIYLGNNHVWSKTQLKEDLTEYPNE